MLLPPQGLVPYPGIPDQSLALAAAGDLCHKSLDGIGQDTRRPVKDPPAGTPQTERDAATKRLAWVRNDYYRYAQWACGPLAPRREDAPCQP